VGDDTGLLICPEKAGLAERRVGNSVRIATWVPGTGIIVGGINAFITPFMGAADGDVEKDAEDGDTAIGEDEIKVTTAIGDVEGASTAAVCGNAEGVVADKTLGLAEGTPDGDVVGTEECAPTAAACGNAEGIIACGNAEGAVEDKTR